MTKKKEKYPTYTYDKYEQHSNTKIIELLNEMDSCKSNLRRIEQDIKDIQDNCIHEYMFVYSGAYENAFACKLCGHETWK